VPLRSSVPAGLLVLAGGALFWIPVLAFYALEGRLAEYVGNTFTIGGFVLAGYSNIPTSGSITRSLSSSALFYGFVPFAILAGASVLYGSREAEKPLAWDRVSTLALVSISAACFFSSLTRTDIYHLLNVLVSVPLLLVQAVRAVPGFLSPNRAPRWIVRAGLLCFVYLVTFQGKDVTWLVTRIEYPLRKFAPFERAVNVPGEMEGVQERMGYQSLPAEIALEAAISVRDERSVYGMHDYFSAFAEMREPLKGKTVYVHSLPGAVPGFLSFLLDVTPAPVLLDPMMVANADIRERFVEHYETIVDEVDCIVADERAFAIPEVHWLLEASPRPKVSRRAAGGAYIGMVCR
jgi:hypothetical protein